MLKRSVSSAPGIPCRNVKTLADLVLDFPDDKAEQTALTFLNGKGHEVGSFSYAGLRQSCVRVAKNLLRTSNRSEPVLLAVESESDFVVGFFGCLLAGLAPAPMPPLNRKRGSPGVGRIMDILKQRNIHRLIVNRSDADWVRSALTDAKLADVAILAVESLGNDDPPQIELPEINPDQTAYLQFTSGSTSASKAVVLKHRNVIADLEMMYRVFKRDEIVRVASWLPLHHDMGLVGHLFTVLFECGFGVFMPPRAFLTRPALWLEVVHKYRANSSAAPNFAFAHCVRKVDASPDWDLSCWKNVYVGSETVILQVLDSFASTFGRFGFRRNSLRPVYGLAEASLLAAGGSLGLDELVPLIETRSIGPTSQRRLMAYTLEDGCEVTIRDPDSATPVAEGVSGEIWISGPGVSSGYFLEPETDVRDVPGIGTGDLGFIKSGCLYVSGRKKEIVIVRGQNYCAEDLELAAAAGIDRLAGNNRTACVSHIDETGEHVLVFQEIHRHTAPDELRSAYLEIRGNLVEAFGIDPDEVIFLATGTLPTTANNKIARQACRREFLTGGLKVLGRFAKQAVEQPQARPVMGETDPVVIVGMACRFPGADDPQQFWQNLCSGHDAITEVPADRWNNSVFYDQSPAMPGKLNTKWAGFLENISHFDAALFGISPHEAPEIDPQQRLLLEVSWRLIENAGLKKERLAGSATGVYIGISTNDYLYSKIKLTSGMSTFNAYSGLGNANSIAANRISYYYDLHGPSLAVDTACSSSLTAFHLGARAILNGECQQAIVGGVNAILSPGPTITLCQFGMMAPDGRCKTFDASADGYVRAEGCGLVFLKRRSAALADGDHILAIVDGTVIAQDGASKGITFPNGAAQDQLIATVLQYANLQGSEVSYVEAHGTGTSAGDPVEVEQIKKHYGAAGNDTCFVGSVKANIGHLEAAAGIASVIKTVLMLEHKKIPPQIHVKTLNPRLRLEHTRLAIANALTDWQPGHSRRRAAISSFGFGGSLAHVILAEAADDGAPSRALEADFSGAYPHPFVVSAHTPEALRAQLAAMSRWLKTMPSISLRDICRTLATGRSDLSHRACFLATTRKGVCDKIDAWLQLDQEIPSTEDDAEICFLFTGQGEHYLHMGKEMYERFPVFKAAFDRCAAAIDGPQQPFSLRELAFSIDDTRLWSDQYMQPILFAVQYALATLYQECGIRPSRLAGHSLGEYAAACLAGCLEPEAAMRILHRRGELIRSLSDKGFMAAIFAPAEDIRQVMNQAKVQVAAINGPKKTTISGEAYEVDRVMKLFAEKGVETYFLKTDQAFHSHLLDPILDEFRRELSGYSFAAPTTPWISSVTGEVKTDAPDADYWTDQLRQPVLFGQATKHLGGARRAHFIEIGPGATCLASVRENLRPVDSLCLRSLNVKKGDRTESYFFLDAIGQLYKRGHAIHWPAILTGRSVPRLLPGLQFIQQPYWMKGLSAEAFSAFAAPGSKPAISHNDDRKDWHYRLEWVDAGALSEPAYGERATRKFNWLVVGTPGPFSEALTYSIEARHEEVYCLSADSIGSDSLFRRSAATPRKADAAAWSKTIAKVVNLKSRVGAKDWKILYVADPGEVTQWSAAALEAVQRREFAALIPMLQALREQGLVHPVWILTEDAQTVPQAAGAKLNLGASPVWGFGKTLYLEHPEWRGGMIDLTAADPVRTKADNAVKKIVNQEFESCVALRGHRQYVQKIVRAPLAAGAAARFRDDGVYIITGGLGGLGLAFAEWAVARGARKLVLLSRRTVPDRSTWPSISENEAEHGVVRKLMALTDAGAEVETISLDVRDGAALANLFDRLDEKKIAVRGIVHAAGVNWFGKVMTLAVDQFLDTLKTKITASWELHRHSLDRDLDCFVLFSSVSAVWGSVELSHYTAANQFMDMLSLHRRALGLPALCVDWGPWADVGMSANHAEQTILEKLGFVLMPPDRALAAMEAVLAADRPLSLIADMDWARFQIFIDFCLQPSMFSGIAANRDRFELLKPGKLAAILNAPPDEARDTIEKIVRMKLRSVTLIESSDTIDAEQRFNFMGMDSLMSLSFAAELESYFHAELPSTLTYNYPNIRAVTDYLFDLLYLPTPRPALETAASPPLDDESLNPSCPLDGGAWFKLLKPASGKKTNMLFCLPYAGSGVSAFAPLALAIGAGTEVVGVQIPGREDHDNVPACRSMDALIGSLIEIFPEQDADYFIFGHSLGAVVAYEFVLALQLSGKRLPRGLIVSGCNAPLARSDTLLHRLDSDDFIARLVETYNPPDSGHRELALRRNEDLLRADLELLETYQPSKKPVSVPLTVIHARQDPLIDHDKIRQWVDLSADSFNLVVVDGDHQLPSTLHRRLADIIEQAMRASQNDH
jgi:acyl transferase domain-containing protein/acyl-CoA synthetase (AMP-forming)/AMP-acid ligase II/surfactin synthase thioesterase subunit